MTPTSGTWKPRTDANGFTLLELTLTLAIIGLGLGLSMAYFHFSGDTLEPAAKEMASVFARARAEAMLARKKVTLETRGGELWQTGEATKRIFALPDDVAVGLNGKTMVAGTRGKFVFNPLGFAAESLLVLRRGDNVWTVYVPAIGAPRAIKGAFSANKIHEAIQ